MLAIVGAPAGAEELHLPNLSPMPPYHLYVGEPDFPEDPEAAVPERALRFAVTTFNHSDYALDLTFLPSSADDVLTNGRDAFQCVSFAGPVCTQRRPAGRATFHEPHNHWHFDDYAYYTLVPVTPDGLPDFDAEPVAPGVKASFCIIDTDRHDYAQVTHVSTYQGCFDLRQGMTGWHGDTYHAGLPGQQIVIDDVPPGLYALVVVANPIGRLFESSAEDNRAWAVIELASPGCNHDKVTVHATGIS